MWGILGIRRSYCHFFLRGIIIALFVDFSFLLARLSGESEKVVNFEKHFAGIRLLFPDCLIERHVCVGSNNVGFQVCQPRPKRFGYVAFSRPAKTGSFSR